MPFKTVNDFYHRMAEIIRTSDKEFYRHYDDRRTYQDLHLAIRRLNSALVGQTGARVAIYGTKGFDVYASIFATLLSGNTWIPLNPAAPDARNAEIIDLAAPDFIICDNMLTPKALAAVERQRSQIIDLESLLSSDVEVNIDLPNFPDDALSMIYFTSGSTGQPKGVLVTHLNYIINVQNILELVDLGEDEVFADYHDLGFVISVPVLFPCVMKQGALSPGIGQHDVILPLDHMNTNGVTVLITVPSTIARIRKSRRAEAKLPKLNVLISCGEPMHLDVLDFVANEMAARQIFNFYGSTEVAPWIFYHRCTTSDIEDYKEFGYVPVGTPIKGNEITITEVGELWVSSDQVVPGYLNDANNDRFPTIDGKRWYCTGDKVISHDGVYICKGRLDSQIKIGGYRIELMDVESHLRALDGVEAAVCFPEGENGKK